MTTVETCIEVATDDAVELATLASPAIVIEPELLRTIRLRAAPHLDVGAEANLWFSPLVQTRNATGIAFDPDVAAELRERLRASLATGVGRWAAECAWHAIEQRHDTHLDILSPALALEERLAWKAITGAGHEELEGDLARAVATYETYGGDGVAWWAAQAWTRLPPQARATHSGLALRHLGALAGADGSLALQETAGGIDLASLVTGLRRVRVGVRRDGDELQIGDVTGPNAFAVEVPDTDPRLLSVIADEERTDVAVRAGEVLHIAVGEQELMVQNAVGERFRLPAAPAVDVLFLSYAPEDHDWAQRFASALATFAAAVELFVPPPVREGDDVRSQLERARRQARVGVLLISPAFLASDELLDRDLPVLSESGVMAVLIRECQWEAEPALKDVQWAHAPAADGPLAAAADPDREIRRIWDRILDAISPAPPAVGSRSTAAGDPALAGIVRAAAAGDARAWEAIVERFTPTLRRIARFHRLPAADVDDVVQATWIRAIANIHSLRDPSAIGAWLATTARREAMRMLRRGSTPVDDDLLGDAPSPEPEVAEAIAAREEQETLQRMLRTLTDRQRRLLELMIAEPDLSYLEISERLGMPIGAIGPTRGRALERLREEVRRQGW